MAYLPPVNLPDLSQQKDYGAQLYGMLANTGQAFYQNRRDKVGDAQWDQEQERLSGAQALAQSNADRNYALDMDKWNWEKDHPASDSPESMFGNTFVYADPNSLTGYGRAGITNHGTVVPLPAPGGEVGMPSGPGAGPGSENISTMSTGWLPDVTFNDAGDRLLPAARQGGGYIGAPVIKGGTPAAGYSPQTGPNGETTFDPAPGSPQDMEKRAAKTAAFRGIGVLEEKASVLQDQITGIRSEGADGQMSTGFGGRIERALPWETSGSKLASRLDTVKNVIVRDTLQQMRDMSKTGGAVGQVSDFETRLYQASQGPLDPNNPTTMMETLDTIERTYNEAKTAYRIAYMIDFEGLDQQTGFWAIDAIRQGEDPEIVMQALQRGGQ